MKVASTAIPIFFNAHDIAHRINGAKHVKQWLQCCALEEGFPIKLLQYVWCSDEALLQINRDHLQHDYYTDVITFDYSEGDEIVGDIYISITRIKEHAHLYKTSVKTELHRVMVHGLLHLCGYSDNDPLTKSEMTDKEDYYLSLRTF